MEKEVMIDTTKYVLMLRITDNELTYVYYHPAEDDSLVSERIALHYTGSLSRAVEEVVYEREVLLQSFRRVYVLLPSKRHLLVPSEVATSSDSTLYYRSLYADDNDEIVECRMPATGAVMFSGADKDLVRFVQRTFDRPTLLHPLSALCEYFYRKSRMGNQRKMYVHLYNGVADVVCYGRDGLLLANSYDYRCANDVVYHVLNVWKQLGLDQRVDEVHIAGDGNMRRDVSTVLRNYILTVVPVIFPSHRHALGSASMQLSFDLTALSLCEL